MVVLCSFLVHFHVIKGNWYVFILFFQEKKPTAHQRISEHFPASRAISRWSDFYSSDGLISKMTYLINVVEYTYPLCASRTRDPLWHFHRLLAVPYLLLVVSTVCDAVLLSIREWEQIEKTEEKERRKDRKESRWVSVTLDTAFRENTPREVLSVTVT